MGIDGFGDVRGGVVAWLVRPGVGRGAGGVEGMGLRAVGCEGEWEGFVFAGAEDGYLGLKRGCTEKQWV